MEGQALMQRLPEALQQFRVMRTAKEARRSGRNFRKFHARAQNLDRCNRKNAPKYVAPLAAAHDLRALLETFTSERQS
jgi:hypothetical protein